ncbi:MAG: Crp/Fnr family transcriptional regulator [Anaerolineae bacterium]|nr:Crp/Fnr family transcriptional regulator [Anaerolineae bacterium]MDQ7034705.1 Crp/Fnr family transcriptional regulator [Anaerolineae bacterium]
MATTFNLSVLRNSFLFKEADETVLQAVGKQCETLILGAGETLFDQDTRPNDMYFLADGQIHIVRHYPEGYDVTIATEVPFYVIGELSLLANQPRTGSVVAVSDCDLIRLSHQAVFEICETYPNIARRALSHLGNRLYRFNLWVRESAVSNVGARIASILLLMSDSQNRRLDNVSMTRLARATAMDADVVERLLRQWHDYGAIRLDKQQITILNIETLQTFAG